VGHKDFLGNQWVVGGGVFAGWFASVFTTLNFGGFEHEIPSFWCLISMPFLFLPYFVAVVFRPNRFNFDEYLYSNELVKEK